MSKQSTISIPVNDSGFLVMREMKDDNSCLFRSIGYLLDRNPENVTSLRQIIKEFIMKNPDDYSEAILGKSPEEYCRWITSKDAWGGAIELCIFSDYYKTEIDSIDISTLRVDRFGQDKYPDRVFILYSGIHYDALALSPALDCPMDFDVTKFPVDSSDLHVNAAIKFASKMKEQRKFTDLAKFTLKCGVCNKGVVGQKDAQAHAMETGHVEFAEY